MARTSGKGRGAAKGVPTQPWAQDYRILTEGVFAPSIEGRLSVVTHKQDELAAESIKSALKWYGPFRQVNT